MREYCLDELFDLQMGKTPSRNNSAYWNNGSNDWISIGDLSGFGKYVGETKEQLTDLAVSESGIKSIPVDTVVMSFKLSIGKLAITTEEIYSNEAIMAFIDKEIEKIYPDYLYYLLLSKDWNEGTNKAVMGKTLNKATLSKVKIKLHEFSEQEEIVLVLDKVNKLLTLRKQQLEDLDNLIKSRFVEMFGDLFLNTMKWDEKTVDELCIEIVDCVNRTAPLSDNQTPYKMIRTSNIQNGKIDSINVNCVEKDVYEKWIRRLKPEKGDVLFTREAPTGNVGLVEDNEKIFLGQRIMHYRPNQEFINPYYLVMSLMSTDIDRQINKISTGSTVKHLSVDECKKFIIKLPPVDLQNQFATFVQQVDKLKVEVQKSLNETQLLFDSLMQKYYE